MSDTLLIKILANAQQALNEIKEVNQKLGNTTEQAEKVKKSLTMTDVWAGFTMAKGVITSVVGALTEFTGSANSARLSVLGLNEVSKAYGQSALQANKDAKELTEDGLMKLISSSQTLKFLLASKFSISEAMDIAKSMKDIGAFNNTIGNLDQAMVDAAKGIKTGSIELIENIGLTQKLSSVMDAAGVSTAQGIDITNNAAQRQALYNAIMAEGNKFQGNAAKLASDSLGIYAQLGNSYEQLKIKIGETLNVGFVPLAEMLTKAVTLLKDHFAIAAGIAIGAMSGLVVATGTLTIAVASLATAVTGATAGMNLLVAAVVALGIGGASAGVISLTNNVDKFSIALTESNERIQAIKNGLADMTKEELRAQIAQKQRELDIQNARNDRLYAQRAEQLAELERMKSVRAWNTEEKQLAADKIKQSIDINDAVRRENKQSLELYKQQLAAILNAPPVAQNTINNIQTVLDEALKANKKQLDSALAQIVEFNKKVEEYDKSRVNNTIDIESHAKGVKQRADAKELKRMQSYGMEAVELDEKIAKAKIRGDQDAEESSLSQAQAAISSAQSVFAAQANKSKSMFEINKQLSAVQAGIATYEGATNAYASGAKIDPTGIWPATYAGIVTAAGLANVAFIESQEYEPVEDFISIPGKPLLKARPDDIVIGGTNLLGNNSGSSDPILKAIQTQTKVLQGKTMSAILNLGDRLVYLQNLKGQKAVNQRKVY